MTSEQRRPATTLATQHLFGLDFVSNSELSDVVDQVMSYRARPGAPIAVVVTPNVDHIVRYDRYPGERSVAERATLVLPDGVPIVWASRLLRRPIDRRLAGSDLFGLLWNALRADNRSVMLVAANQSVAARAAVDYPGADVVVAPQLDLESPQMLEVWARELLGHLSERPSDVVMLTIGTPVAHRITGALLDLPPPPTGGPIILMLGASPEFYFGFRRRAPKWMQRWGLEWLYRLLNEPRRLVRRYLVEDVRFLWIVARHLRSAREPEHR